VGLSELGKGVFDFGREVGQGSGRYPGEGLAVVFVVVSECKLELVLHDFVGEGESNAVASVNFADERVEEFGDLPGLVGGPVIWNE
jgi:hypothetical protein